MQDKHLFLLRYLPMNIELGIYCRILQLITLRLNCTYTLFYDIMRKNDRNADNTIGNSYLVFTNRELRKT